MAMHLVFLLLDMLTNGIRDWSIRDPPLSDLGFQQCQKLRERLQAVLSGRLQPQLVLVSPMKRTLQTAVTSVGWLMETGVPIQAHAGWQETTDNPCDIGSDVSDLAADFPGVDFTHVDPVFPEKKTREAQFYAFNRQALLARAQHVLSELYARPEAVVLVVSHSAFLSQAVSGSMFGNADFRIFSFADVEDSETPRTVSKGDADLANPPRAPETVDSTKVVAGVPPLNFRLREWSETQVSHGGMGWSYSLVRKIGEGLPK